MTMENQTYTYKYPHPAVTCDCVVFRLENGVIYTLLIERGNEPCKGQWAIPGGFLNMDENAEQGALRELEEETGLKLPHATQFGAYTEVGRDPRERTISIAYFTITNEKEVKGCDDAAKAQWFNIDESPPLAFDHNEMLEDAIKCLHQNLQGAEQYWKKQ